MVVGKVRFTKEAKTDLMADRGIIDGPDAGALGWLPDGSDFLLGYKLAYKAPHDPFRWSKLKELVDSCEDIVIDKKNVATDTFEVLSIQGKTHKMVKLTLGRAGAAGLTLVPESVERAIFPKLADMIVSADGKFRIFYTVLLGKADTSALAHELFGHTWLAVKRVPYKHRKASSKAAVAAQDTLDAKHGILDPFGDPFVGTADTFITSFVDPDSMRSMPSKTQNVGKTQYKDALAKLTKLAGGKDLSATKIDGTWQATPAFFDTLDFVSNNHERASATGTVITPSSIEADVTALYKKLAPVKQYAFLQVLNDVASIGTRRSNLARALLGQLALPRGMQPLQPPSVAPSSPAGFGSAPSGSSPP
ncbi:hypothetical protein WME75_10915 [Sorangium sp. So ce1014]|uniref:hypothetical protein n=1 Tax=Sorangium sp. So ce1014 TaxID=3133326 RepID=UPI003F6218F5